jgi:uncharacterized protein YlxW (UPF0749 family)
MLAIRNWKFLVAIGSLLVGILLMYQLKTWSKTNQNSEGQQNTISTLVQYSFEAEKLQAENQKLKDEIEKYQKGADAELVANQRLIRAKQVAALTPIEAQGIRIVLEDSKRPVNDAENVNTYIIHEQYLQEIVNALWSAGAEGIAINGHRMTTHSDIYCMGSVMNIDGEVEPSPYTIEAIGDIQKLNGAMVGVESFFLRISKESGIGYKRESAQNLNLPAGKFPRFKFAVPSKEGS